MEAYQKIIRIYQLSDDPLSEEQQEEVDRFLDEARRTSDHIEDAEEPEEEKDEKAGQSEDAELDAEEARRYRAITARMNYLAVDRVDIQYSVKEAARHMATPKTSSWKLLNKIGRYGMGRPRLVMSFKRQSPRKL